MNDAARELAAAVAGWRDTSPRAERRRELARERARAIALERAHERRRPRSRNPQGLLDEVTSLLASDTPENVLRRVRYSPSYLTKLAYSHGRPDLALVFKRIPTPPKGRS